MFPRSSIFTAAAILTVAGSCRAQGTISTVAGSGVCCASPDGGAATGVWLTINAVAVDSPGNIYIAEGQRVRKVNTAGIITTYAGDNTIGFSGDGGPATSAKVDPAGLAMDSSGNLYIVDSLNQRVRKVDANGIITTIAGNGSSGFSGDGGPATNAQLGDPRSVAVDSSGNVYIADTSNLRIRKVDTAGIITTVAGNGNVQAAGDGGPATSASFDRPVAVAVDGVGNLYLADGRRIRKVDTAGIISTVAGTAQLGFTGDGGPAAGSRLSGIQAMAVDRAGNLYIADSNNQRIRKVDTSGNINTVAGNGAPGTMAPLGDGGPATSASLRNPLDVAFDGAGNFYIADAGHNRIRKVSAGAAAPGISATPTSLTFSFTAGGSAPASQTLNVFASGADLTFTVSATTSTGGNWLTVTPASGTTPGTLTVSIIPAGLTPGSYQGAITLTPGGTGNSPQNVAVTVTVNGPGAPVITSNGVVNATGYQNKLAPDTVFVVFGGGMGPASLAAAAAPYPDSLSGTSITFTPAGGGAAITAKMVYTVAGQVAGLLPSSIPPGVYAVRVIYNGQPSAPQNVTVVQRSFGIATANSAGSGPAQATIGNVNSGVSLVRFTTGGLTFNGLNWTLSPAHPGDTLVFWGTGGGADPANDTGGTSGDQTGSGNFVVTVGGRRITPQYAGASSGYPGLWQINFTLPADIAPDCFAWAQVSAGGEVSNLVSIAIAAPGQNACTDPNVTPGMLTKLDAGGDIVVAAFAAAKLTATAAGVTNESISGAVLRFTAAEWILTNSGPRYGACRVYDRTYPRGGKDPASPEVSLDAGARLSVSGPNLPQGFGMGSVATASGPVYLGSPSAGTLTSGAYTLNGAGGSQVGPFSAMTTFPGNFTVTNYDSVTVIDRSRPLTFNWTGSGLDQVSILANSATDLGANVRIVTISCFVPGSLGTYSVPSAALAYLQPAAATGANFGSVSIGGHSASGAFTATLAGGGQTDFGGFEASINFAKNIAVQ